MSGNSEFSRGRNGNDSVPPEYIITKLLCERLEEEDCLLPGDRQSVSYRISEIMVAAKELYTVCLPRMIGQVELPQHLRATVMEELAYLRMALLRISDLISDFDEAFMEAMANQREVDDQEKRED